MTKQELIEAVSSKTGRQKGEVEFVLESVLGVITEALTLDGRVDLRGFGSFVVKDRKERPGRNPRTGETITIRARREVNFKSGKVLGEKLAHTETQPETP